MHTGCSEYLGVTGSLLIWKNEEVHNLSPTVYSYTIKYRNVEGKRERERVGDRKC